MPKEAHARKKVWRCNVCNDIHYGIRGPEICPTCGARNAFALADPPEAMKVIIDRGERIDQEDLFLDAWERFAKDKPFRLNPDEAFVRQLARGEIENLKNHGLRYCPCRITTGDLEDDFDLICPCNFFIQPVYKETGECWCGLFVKR